MEGDLLIKNCWSLKIYLIVQRIIRLNRTFLHLRVTMFKPNLKQECICFTFPILVGEKACFPVLLLQRNWRPLTGCYCYLMLQKHIFCKYGVHCWILMTSHFILDHKISDTRYWMGGCLSQRLSRRHWHLTTR